MYGRLYIRWMFIAFLEGVSEAREVLREDREVLEELLREDRLIAEEIMLREVIEEEEEEEELLRGEQRELIEDKLKGV